MASNVAKLLGDTIETIEAHYADFVKEPRKRTKRIMEISEGLELRPAARFKSCTSTNCEE
jgi:hypothetical protein